MGGDGGTLNNSRREHARIRQTSTKTSSLPSYPPFTHCHLSQTRLQAPVVADRLGYLYNKTAILEHLLSRNSLPYDPIAHIRRFRRDVCNVRLRDGRLICEETRKEAAAVGAGVEVGWECGCVSRVRDDEICGGCGKKGMKIRLVSGMEKVGGIRIEGRIVKKRKGRNKKKKMMMKMNVKLKTDNDGDSEG